MQRNLLQERLALNSTPEEYLPIAQTCCSTICYCSMQNTIEDDLGQDDLEHAGFDRAIVQQHLRRNREIESRAKTPAIQVVR